MSTSMGAALLAAAALLAGVGGCSAGSGLQQRPAGDGPRVGEGQWAFAIRSADGAMAKSVLVVIGVECVVARDSTGAPARAETRTCEHLFADGTITADVAAILAYLLRERLTGLGVEIEHEPGSESLFIGGPDIVGIGAGSEDESELAIHMSCTVGPPAGRKLAVPARDDRDG